MTAGGCVTLDSTALGRSSGRGVRLRSQGLRTTRAASGLTQQHSLPALREPPRGRDRVARARPGAAKEGNERTVGRRETGPFFMKLLS